MSSEMAGLGTDPRTRYLHLYALTVDGRQSQIIPIFQPWFRIRIVVRSDDNGEQSFWDVSVLLNIFVDIVVLFNSIQCACDPLINLISS